MESQNIFKGKWRIVSLHGYIEEFGWILFKLYYRNSFIWEFDEIKQVTFLSRDKIFSGELKERYEIAPEFVTKYVWYPEDKHLYIDRSAYESPDGIRRTSINSHYRVERINVREYWIYDLENVVSTDNVEGESKQYKFRMKIRKIE